MTPSLIDHLTATGWRQAPTHLAELERAALSALGYPNLNAFLADPGIRITIVLIHAGNATRWARSLAEHPELAHRYQAAPAEPRGLAMIDNLLSPTPPSVPMLTYAYHGLKPLLTDAQGAPLPSRRHITYHQRPDDASRFLAAAGYAGVTTQLQTKPALQRGKVPGHAAELCNLLPELTGADIIITLFGSDPISHRTAILSALTLRALMSTGEPISVILPTAPAGAYPVSVDSTGLVRSLTHNKLDNLGTPSSHLVPGGSNVGLRFYAASQLLPILQAAKRRYDQTGTYTPDGGEFSLDHVDAQFAAAGRCRQLYIATPAEATPTKDITQLTAFIEAERTLIKTNEAPQ